MAFRAPLVNFSRGELAPELYGRFDVASYAAGLKRARNVVILKTGAVTIRPGTRYVGEVYDSTQPGRLFSFQFSTEQAYALEFGQGTMRPVALGGFVVEPEYAITGATQANPVVITMPFHPYVAGDDIYIYGQAGMTQINDSIWRVGSVIDASHFSIIADGRAWGAWTGNTGGITLTSTPTPTPPPTVPPPVVTPPPPDVLPGGGSGSGRTNRNGGGGHLLIP